MTATGTADFGYFGGGDEKSTVDRVDYNNDTVTASPKGPLVFLENGLQQQVIRTLDTLVVEGTTSVVDRIDYSNDTATVAPKGPLISARPFGN